MNYSKSLSELLFEEVTDSSAGVDKNKENSKENQKSEKVTQILGIDRAAFFGLPEEDLQEFMSSLINPTPNFFSKLREYKKNLSQLSSETGGDSESDAGFLEVKNRIASVIDDKFYKALENKGNELDTGLANLMQITNIPTSMGPVKIDFLNIGKEDKQTSQSKDIKIFDNLGHALFTIVNSKSNEKFKIKNFVIVFALPIKEFLNDFQEKVYFSLFNSQEIKPDESKEEKKTSNVNDSLRHEGELIHESSLSSFLFEAPNDGGGQHTTRNVTPEQKKEILDKQTADLTQQTANLTLASLIGDEDEESPLEGAEEDNSLTKYANDVDEFIKKLNKLDKDKIAVISVGDTKLYYIRNKGFISDNSDASKALLNSVINQSLEIKSNMTIDFIDAQSNVDLNRSLTRNHINDGTLLDDFNSYYLAKSTPNSKLNIRFYSKKDLDYYIKLDPGVLSIYTIGEIVDIDVVDKEISLVLVTEKQSRDFYDNIDQSLADAIKKIFDDGLSEQDAENLLSNVKLTPRKQANPGEQSKQDKKAQSAKEPDTSSSEENKNFLDDEYINKFKTLREDIKDLEKALDLDRSNNTGLLNDEVIEEIEFLAKYSALTINNRQIIDGKRILTKSDIDFLVGMYNELLSDDNMSDYLDDSNKFDISKFGAKVSSPEKETETNTHKIIKNEALQNLKKYVSDNSIPDFDEDILLSKIDAPDVKNYLSQKLRKHYVDKILNVVNDKKLKYKLTFDFHAINSENPAQFVLTAKVNADNEWQFTAEQEVKLFESFYHQNSLTTLLFEADLSDNAKIIKKNSPMNINHLVNLLCYGVITNIQPEVFTEKAEAEEAEAEAEEDAPEEVSIKQKFYNVKKEIEDFLDNLKEEDIKETSEDTIFKLGSDLVARHMSNEFGDALAIAYILDKLKLRTISDPQNNQLQFNNAEAYIQKFYEHTEEKDLYKSFLNLFKKCLQTLKESEYLTSNTKDDKSSAEPPAEPPAETPEAEEAEEAEAEEKAPLPPTPGEARQKRNEARQKSIDEIKNLSLNEMPFIIHEEEDENIYFISFNTSNGFRTLFQNDKTQYNSINEFINANDFRNSLFIQLEDATKDQFNKVKELLVNGFLSGNEYQSEALSELLKYKTRASAETEAESPETEEPETEGAEAEGAEAESPEAESPEAESPEAEEKVELSEEDKQKVELFTEKFKKTEKLTDEEDDLELIKRYEATLDTMMNSIAAMVFQQRTQLAQEEASQIAYQARQDSMDTSVLSGLASMPLFMGAAIAMPTLATGGAALLAAPIAASLFGNYMGKKSLEKSLKKGPQQTNLESDVKKGKDQIKKIILDISRDILGIEEKEEQDSSQETETQETETQETETQETSSEESTTESFIYRQGLSLLIEDVKDELIYNKGLRFLFEEEGEEEEKDDEGSAEGDKKESKPETEQDTRSIRAKVNWATISSKLEAKNFFAYESTFKVGNPGLFARVEKELSVKVGALMADCFGIKVTDVEQISLRAMQAENLAGLIVDPNAKQGHGSINGAQPRGSSAKGRGDLLDLDSFTTLLNEMEGDVSKVIMYLLANGKLNSIFDAGGRSGQTVQEVMDVLVKTIKGEMSDMPSSLASDAEEAIRKINSNDWIDKLLRRARHDSPIRVIYTDLKKDDLLPLVEKVESLLVQFSDGWEDPIKATSVTENISNYTIGKHSCSISKRWKDKEGNDQSSYFRFVTGKENARRLIFDKVVFINDESSFRGNDNFKIFIGDEINVLNEIETAPGIYNVNSAEEFAKPLAAAIIIKAMRAAKAGSYHEDFKLPTSSENIIGKDYARAVVKVFLGEEITYNDVPSDVPPRQSESIRSANREMISRAFRKYIENITISPETSETGEEAGGPETQTSSHKRREDLEDLFDAKKIHDDLLSLWQIR